VFAHFFINRPIFATVLSIIITIAGAIAYAVLPVAQYPEITPPTVQVTATWSGASAQDVSTGVAIPIEKQVNGVENMLYMESRCTNDGQMNMIVTFRVGADLNMAQVLVQNRVSMAMAKLPESVKQTGVTVNKQSPSILLVINFFSDDVSIQDPKYRDPIYLSNYVNLQVRDTIARIDGVGNVTLFGEREYSIRINLDPLKLAMRGLTPVDVINAIREQNQQVAAGQVGQPPVPPKIHLDFQNTINVFGRLKDRQQFEEIVLKTARDPQSNSVSVLKLKDVAEVVLGAKEYSTDCTVDGKPSVGLALYQLPGSNALETAAKVKETLAKLKKSFPPGVNAAIYYDTTPFINESIHEVEKTLRDAVILVAIVVLLFLQTWRAAIIPLIAVPVSIIGTCAVMAALGFSLNNLTLFGLVLAIGIVVDDAIVVVENVEHHMEHGLTPLQASHKAMDEVSGPVIAVALVLCAVFVPSAFISGIQGLFFKQFALTIAVSTVISAFNSLTLSPALSAILLRPKTATPDLLQRVLNGTIGYVFRAFNRGFDAATRGYIGVVKRMLRFSMIALLVYGGLLLCTGYMFTHVPTGFIPSQDKGYLVADIQLPDAMALDRTKELASRFDAIARGEKGVLHTIGIPGQSAVTGAFNPNTATFFIILDEFSERPGDKFGADAIGMRIFKKAQAIREARISVFGAPAVDGLGNAGGFKLQVQDKGDLGIGTLEGIGDLVARDANAQKGLVGVFSSFRASTPQVRLDIDRPLAKSKGLNLNDVFTSLEATFGAYYVNDITLFNNNFQVKLQARPGARMRVQDIGMVRVRNSDGQMIALDTFAVVKEDSGPSMVTRYNTFPSTPIMGGSLPGLSSGQVLSMMDQICDKNLPPQMSYEWTDLSYQQVNAGNTGAMVFAVSVLLVFLVLAAQYESWVLPLSVILIVPMCLLCAVIGIAIAKMDINIFTQIGLVVLVGLSSKNAILIVEFAKQKREEGAGAFDAAIEACRLRLRPIMMTSFAFILGVLPLVLSTGAGAEMRRTLGVAVFSGMLGVTFFGIFLTPVFYFVLQRLTSKTAAPPR
jgi:multidrug efflux pump